MEIQKNIEIIIEERAGTERDKEPVTFGIPFPKRLLSDKNYLSLVGGEGHPIPLQTEILSTWPDKSIKWLLCDFMIDCPPGSTVNYYLTLEDALPEQSLSKDTIRIDDSGPFLTIHTGKAEFTLDRKTYLPFKNIKISGHEIIDNSKSCVVLKDENQREFLPIIKETNIENAGHLRSTIKVKGQFRSDTGEIFADFFSRLSFYAGKSVVKIDFSVRNPKTAGHHGGLWDLGDKGSVYFEDLSFHVAVSCGSDTAILYKTGINQEERRIDNKRIEIYQDSSGGENWDSPAHMNRFGKVMNSFRGFRVISNDVIEEGYRATPAITIASEGKAISASIQNFWQNFPKSLEAGNNILTMRLFPEKYKDVFELQGGEQKTHTLYLQFESAADKSINLDWIQEPLIARANPELYAGSTALGYLAPMRDDKNPGYQKLIDNVIKGGNTFFDLREKADEYGWRNFGDIYAEHEIAGYKGSHFPFISHYNNQYDVINGCILQYARTGNLTWYQLMTDLAGHVIDIDIYHTKKDRPAFNGGIFWHTDHFMHAETSTHRSFSRVNAVLNDLKSYGGGMSPENCYTTGLCMYYYLTGGAIAKEAVIEVADWIMNMDRLEMSLFGFLRKGKRIVYSLLDKYSRAPGRSPANSVNTLLDAYELTGDRKYLQKAESIIKKFISPTDDIDMLNQQQIEIRWFYLIFLQSVGKYLDIKDGMEDRDEIFTYARESFFYHARWMLDNEVPYKQLFHVVEIPSSTWPAQDIRKSVIFDYACKYSNENLKKAFKEKAEFFYNRSISDVLSFEDGSATLVRPLAILMNYGVMHTYFQNTV